jgi:DNA-binding MarR family transcriptional regulator
MPGHASIEGYTGFLLRKISMASFGGFSEVCGEYGLHPMHFGLLTILAAEGPISQRALSERTGVDASTMVQRMDALESEGLIERGRKVDDRRSYQIELTARGREVLKELKGEANAHMDRVFGALTAEERSELHRLLVKVANALPGD